MVEILGKLLHAMILLGKGHHLKYMFQLILFNCPCGLAQKIGERRGNWKVGSSASRPGPEFNFRLRSLILIWDLYLPGEEDEDKDEGGANHHLRRWRRGRHPFFNQSPSSDDPSLLTSGFRWKGKEISVNMWGLSLLQVGVQKIRKISRSHIWTVLVLVDIYIAIS